MTDLSISKTLDTPAALTDEQHAQRRRGIIAALQMMNDVMHIADVEGKGMEDDAYYAARDVAFAEAPEAALNYLRAFAAQSEHAQRGFAYILGTFFSEIGEGSTVHPSEYWSAPYFANPPLSISQIYPPDGEATSRHNGIKPTAQQFIGGARSWLASLPPADELPIPQTEADGRARFVRLAVELRYMNGRHYKTKCSEKHVDAAIRQSMTWPEAARRGFTAMISRWTVTQALGCGHNLESEIESFGAQADKPYFDEMDRRETEELDRAIAKDDARAAARKAARKPAAAVQAQPVAQA